MIIRIDKFDHRKIVNFLQENPMIEVIGVVTGNNSIVFNIDAPDFMEFPEWVTVCKK